MPSKERSYKVWTSLGIFVQVRNFMNNADMLMLQELNRFFYNHGVSRAQSKFTIYRPPAVFYWSTGDNFESNLLVFDKKKNQPFMKQVRRLKDCLLSFIRSDFYIYDSGKYTYRESFIKAENK